MFSLRVFHNNRIDEVCNYLSFAEANDLCSSLNSSIVSSLDFPLDDRLELDPLFYFFIEKVIEGVSDEG